MSEWE
jgi:small subunit ribosomal protein S5